MKNKKTQQMLENLGLSFMAIALAMVVAAVIMLIVGYNPLNAYAALLNGAFGSSSSFANTLSKSIPLLFTGLAFAFANKGGIFNIGGEGQLYAGAMASTIVALVMDGMPRYIVILTAVAAGILAGALVGGLIGAVKVKLQINEVIVAIMLNYIVLYFTSYLVTYPFKQEGAMTAQTVDIGSRYMFHKIIPRTQLTTTLILGIVIALLIYLFFAKTRFGYNIRAVGENRFAAQASGVPMVATAILTMAISGALSGLAGVTEVFGKTGRFIDGFSPGFGFTGIAVAVLANNHPVGVILSALLFGILEAGSMKMSYTAGISASMVNVIQGLVILFVATPNIIRYMKKRKGGR